MTRRNKPKTPEAIAAEKLERRRADFEAVNLPSDGANLPAWSDVTVQLVNRKAIGNRAWRSNVFRLLLERKTITLDHYDAAYTLANDWAAWKGLDGQGERAELVDCGSGCAELVTDRMIKAGGRVCAALLAFDHASRTIMEAFMVATVEEDRAMQWRGIMERCGVPQGSVSIVATKRDGTQGKVRADRQTFAVLSALEALRRHYQEPGRVAA